MSGDALTIVVGVAGALASAVVSFVIYRLAARDTKEELRQVREFFSGFVKQVEERDHQNVEEASRQAFVAARPPVPAPGAPPTVQLLVSASLGALLNERGEVSVSRLFEEVGQALGKPSTREVESVLRQMRDDGSIDWVGSDDLAGVEAVRVLVPQHADRPGLSPDQHGEPVT